VRQFRAFSAPLFRSHNIPRPRWGRSQGDTQIKRSPYHLWSYNQAILYLARWDRDPKTICSQSSTVQFGESAISIASSAANWMEQLLDRGMTMNTLFVGSDVHKATIAVATAEEGRRGEVRSYGAIENSPTSVGRLLRRLSQSGRVLHFCYEAGCRGYNLHRQICAAGHQCSVIAQEAWCRASPAIM
jgi:hypothetical protein